ncbi:MAG TPA: ribonuclease H-like domain-containing protein [bacterium]|nr:ribonuclease H-like domain-containing protein [bacterium]
MTNPAMGTAGYDIHTRTWPLDRIHGISSLAEAVEVGREAGPPGSSVAWLDTETTGLAGGTGTYVFLIGVATVDGGVVRLTQYFLRDLAAEPEMLDDVRTYLRRFDALVTFNGTRFDLPLLQTRFLLCRIRADLETTQHLDVMGLARRLWHRRLGGYSMALLEQTVLKVERAGDVPGWMIPSLYVQFLHTGDLDLLEPVFAHNAHDILSLVALHGIAGEVLAHPERVPVMVDWFGLGRLLDERDQAEPASVCYRRAVEDEGDPGSRRRAVTALARYYRRTERLDALVTLWTDEVERGVLPRWQPLERLAMIWEWELRDCGRALAYADQAVAALGADRPVLQQRLIHRRQRLLRKVTAVAPTLDPQRSAANLRWTSA